MARIQELPTILTGPGPAIRCLPMPAFDARDLNSIYEMFQPVARHALVQSWLETKEPDFAPAFVRTAWRGSTLLVFAELIDADIYNAATAHNQRAWELGDTFEMFFQPPGQSAYVEFQITPNNHRLQLRFANARSLENMRKTSSMDAVIIPEEIFNSRTWVQFESNSWCIYAELRAEDLGEPSQSLHGMQWRCSFSRYDYTRGRKEPVISSTSLHTEPDFHRHHEWGLINFEKGL